MQLFIGMIGSGSAMDKKLPVKINTNAKTKYIAFDDLSHSFRVYPGLILLYERGD